VGFEDGSEDLPTFEAELDVTREAVLREAAESCQENSLVDFGERPWVHTRNSSRGCESILSLTCRKRRNEYTSQSGDRVVGHIPISGDSRKLGSQCGS
jgi:hypothetical protein